MSATASSPPAQPGVFGLAFRDPEAFIQRWHRDGQPYSAAVFFGLALVALLGTFLYGALLGLSASAGQLLDQENLQHLAECGGLFSLCAAISWAVQLPAVYVLNSLTGLRLRASTTFLAALVTAAWGGFALLAFLPVALVYLLAFPGHPGLALFAHLMVFALTGISMACVFGRQIERLEPSHGGGRVWWLLLFVCLLVQLLYSLKLIRFDF